MPSGFFVPSCAREEAIDIARRIAQGYGRIDISQATGGARFDFTVSQALAFWPEDEPDEKRIFDSLYGILMRAWRDGGARAYHMRAKSPAQRGGGPDRRRETPRRALHSGGKA